MFDPEEQETEEPRRAEIDISPEDEQIFDEVWREIRENGWEDMPDGF